MRLCFGILPVFWRVALSPCCLNMPQCCPGDAVSAMSRCGAWCRRGGVPGVSPDQSTVSGGVEVLL